MDRYICIHGHFCQPPKENPWLEEVELQDSAYPYHDWNEKIAADCYAPNAASRILDPDNRIINIINNYAKISFNFGPTQLSWLKRHIPEVYHTIIEADRESQNRFSGHGSAIAQVYNHMIMPLANSRDKHSQVIWGIMDFKYHFKRMPEGMWLPETAVDLETLEILAEHGIKFTILSPHQVKRVKKIGDKKWKDVNGEEIDTKMPYLCRLPSGKTINIFFYNSQISQDIAFGDLLNNGEVFAQRLLSAFSYNQEQPQIVHVATDGETYGHHRQYGDMALAYCLYYIESNNLARITVYGEYLEKHPPTHEVQIIDNTSWSCVHGVERWKDNCGCNSSLHPRWTQGWRAPLRGVMDWLRDTLIQIYVEEMTRYTQDPWKARDDYIGVILDRSVQNVENFFTRHMSKELSKKDKVKILKLLEMQRYAMLAYTSYGWSLDEISGIETVQVMQYAARAMQLAKEVSGISLEDTYIKILERAPSNIQNFKNGATVYEMFVKTAIIDLHRVCAHYAVSSLFEDYPDPETIKINCYTISSEIYDREEVGRQKLAIGKARVRSDITWEESVISFAVLHLGDHNLSGGVREYIGEDSFIIMCQEIKDAFLKSDIPEVIRLMDKHFGMHNYSLWHLFKDKQRKVLDQILEFEVKEIEALLRQIYDHHYPIMHVMNEMQIPLPKALSITGEFVLNKDLRKLLDNEELNLDYLQKLIAEIEKWHFKFDKPTLSFIASRKINTLMEKLYRTPEDISLLGTIEVTLRVLTALPLQLNLWKAQNIYFSISKELYRIMVEKAEKGNQSAKKWTDYFNSLGHYLQMRSR